MAAPLIILGLFLFALALESHRRAIASRRPARPDRDRDLRDLRDYYATGGITLEQLEAQVEDVLEDEAHTPLTGARPAAR